MPGITYRSTKEPLLNTRFLSHGTLECRNLAATRRFYEEVLGLEVVQQALGSLFIRLGGQHCYAVVETPDSTVEMPLLNHNGIDLASEDEVLDAHTKLQGVKDEYGIRRLTKPVRQHGTYSFYLQDLDGNWWEICHLPEGGYAFRFDHPETELTGRDDLSDDEIRHRYQNPLDFVPGNKTTPGDETSA